MSSKRSSGLDFSDGTSTLDQHPDLPIYSTEDSQPSHLRRNKTERRRLQGLQRSTTNSSTSSGPEKPKNFRQKIDLWMINEGGRHLFFAVWILLHILVATFGFFNYELKDNLVDARATFGITYRAFSTCIFYWPSPLIAFATSSYCACGGTRPSR
jgi:hypothetical protein